MEAMEKARQRLAMRLNPEQVFKPVIVSTVNDIKKVVAQFDPAHNPRPTEVPMHARLEANEDGKRNVYQVETVTRSKTKRDILTEGLTIIKNREQAAKELATAGQTVEINGKLMKPAVLNNDIDGRSWIDPLIRQWTGGEREGIFVIWELNDGYKYKYNVFEHALSRVPRQQ